MTSQPRLYTRMRQPDKTIKHLLSQNSIIVLFNIDYDDTRLRQQLSRLPNSHYCRADTTANNCLDLVIEEDAKDAFIMLITSSQFINCIYHSLLEKVP